MEVMNLSFALLFFACGVGLTTVGVWAANRFSRNDFLVQKRNSERLSVVEYRCGLFESDIYYCRHEAARLRDWTKMPAEELWKSAEPISAISAKPIRKKRVKRAA